MNVDNSYKMSLLGKYLLLFNHLEFFVDLLLTLNSEAIEGIQTKPMDQIQRANSLKDSIR